eukprot:TRINITY_DN12623_c0_g1_i2.p3 TRINITY_DN12623_c0_g1~~TRINITY_DN12623_c0_g1_i2.p3  ORF type:complete len:149 (-),score=4.43 TRINITY_DN12623_c0_g1_i2:127-573(-)
MGLFFSLGGIIIDLLLSFVLKSARSQPKLNNIVAKSMSLLCLIMIIIFAVLGNRLKFWILDIVLVLMGIGAIGMLPIAAESCEIAGVPIHNEISVNTWNLVSALFSLAMNKIATESKFGNYAAYSLIILIIPSSIYMIFVFDLSLIHI